MILLNGLNTPFGRMALVTALELGIAVENRVVAVAAAEWLDAANPSRALACLETIVHLNAGGLPLARSLVEITIPATVWAGARRETEASLPVGWDAEPAIATSIAFGTDWIVGKGSALLMLYDPRLGR